MDMIREQRRRFKMRGQRFFLLLGFVLFFGFVSADVISINSGGGAEIVITPNLLIEGFFSEVNERPTDPIVVLTSENGNNETDADLLCSFDVVDSDSDFLNVSINWSRNLTDMRFKSYENVSNGTTINDRLLQGNLTVGDVWACEVRYYDGVEYSNWVTSNNLTIIDVTDPNITILSPLPTNYSTLDVHFNITTNENVTLCYYDLDNAGNTTMYSLNATYYFVDNASIGPGSHDIMFWCLDSFGNWGFNETNFTIENEAAIAIDLSTELAGFVRWNLTTLPVTDLNAIGNNLNASTDYFVNISATNTLVDLYVKADGDLFTAGLDVIGLGNETYGVSLNDSTVSNVSRLNMTTNYTLIGASLTDNATVYMKFYLDAPAAQAAGVYSNQLSFKAVREGESI